MNWRDEKNGMTTAERAKALAREIFATDSDEDLQCEFSLLATIGHTCASAELERHRETQRKLAAAERERDEARATLAQMQEDLRDCQKEQRDDEAIYMKVVADAQAQRDALLAALEEIAMRADHVCDWAKFGHLCSGDLGDLRKTAEVAREAIARAKGGQG